MKNCNRPLLLFIVLTLCLPAFAKKKRTLVDMATDYISDRMDEASVPPPKDQEACFSPGGECDVKFWKFLQTAKKTIDVAIFDLTHPKIAHELAAASKRISVRVVADSRQAKGVHSLIPLLVKAGVPVRLGHQRGIMHNKFTIIDSGWLETGSFNYTDSASFKNNENQLYLNNPKIVEQYQKRFEQIWSEAKPVPPQLASRVE